MNVNADSQNRYQQSEHHCDRPEELLSLIQQLYPNLQVKYFDSTKPLRAHVKTTKLSKAEILELEIFGHACASSEKPIQFLSYVHVLAGQMTYQINGAEALNLNSNQIIVLSPGETATMTVTKHCQLIELRIHRNDFKQLMRNWFGVKHPQEINFIRLPDASQPKVKATMQTIQSLMHYIDQFEGLLHAPLAMASLEEALYMTLLFSFQQHRKTQEAADDAHCIALLESYIESHLHENFTSTKLTTITGCSKTQLYRVFKRHHNCTPLAFVQSKRLQKARELLQQNDVQYSVSHIASLCGFNHLGRFAQAYKQAFNEKPSQTAKVR
jgi:AraC-like DNA-binding protein